MPKPASPSLLSARELRLASWSEADFLREVERAFDSHGWSAMHVRRLQGRDGQWLTGTSKPDYPDLTAVHPSGVAMVLELKGPKGRPTPGQQRWVDSFAKVPGVFAAVVWPRDYDRLFAMICDPASIHRLQPGNS